MAGADTERDSSFKTSTSPLMSAAFLPCDHPWIRFSAVYASTIRSKCTANANETGSRFFVWLAPRPS